jgi:type II secretion system protein G
MRRRIWQGFTLIELLIVVAIIAILAAVAVPNFLEAQVRAKVSRVKADMRTVMVAAELYRTDNGAYPHCFYEDGSAWIQPPMTRCNVLSTPIAYLASIPTLDPFATGVETQNEIWKSHYEWRNYDQFVQFNDDKDGGFSWALGNVHGAPGCWMESRGPDREMWMHAMWGESKVATRKLNFEEAMVDYDASNGTRSFGDVRFFSYGKGNYKRVSVGGGTY